MLRVILAALRRRREAQARRRAGWLDHCCDYCESTGAGGLLQWVRLTGGRIMSACIGCLGEVLHADAGARVLGVVGKDAVHG
jgi:hypothetical protein